MTFETTPAAHAGNGVAAPAPTAAPRRAPPVAALVVFVGGAVRPSAAEAQSLAGEGMRCLWLRTVAQALAAARLACFDALVLDAGVLAARDRAALARLRAALQCPVLLLAERADDEVDEILALELGADAYLAPPVAPRRLRAHLGALLRCRGLRPRPDGDDDDAESPHWSDRGDRWWLDRVGNRLRRGERCIVLTEVQAALMQCLIDADGRVVPRERLMAALPLARVSDPRHVDVYVHRLRKRLVDAGVVDLTIDSVRGRGYAARRPSAADR